MSRAVMAWLICIVISVVEYLSGHKDAASVYLAASLIIGGLMQ